MSKILDLTVIDRNHVRSVEKAIIISKRIQEKKEEELAVAKSSSVCFVSASLNKGQFSPFDPDASKITEYPQMDSISAERFTGNYRQDSVLMIMSTR